MAEAILELDITPALNALDDLDAVFDSITDNFGVSLAGALTDSLAPQIAELDGMLSGLGTDFGANLTEAIQIDQGQLDESVSGVDDLSEGLDTLEASIGQTTHSADIANLSFGALQAGTGLLEGSSSSLLKTIAPGAAIFAGTAVAISGLVERADRAELSISRMNTVFGDSAPIVFEEKIDGLGLSLGDLNKEAGGSNTALRLAIATFGDTAVAAGATQEEAAKVSQNVGFLTAAVTTLNPALGTADQNFQLLTRGLGGSTRILQRYGIQIDAAKQKQLALEIAHQHGREAASLFDKQVAGAALALQALQARAVQAGTTLDQQLAEGLDSNTLKFRKFKQEITSTLTEIGTPLIEPVLEITEKLTPVLIKLITTLGEFAAKVVPALLPVVDAFVDMAGPLTVIVGLITSIPSPVLTAVAAFIAWRNVLGPISGALTKLVTGIGSIGPLAQHTGFAVSAAGEATETTTSKFGKFGDKLKEIGPNLAIAAAGLTIGITQLDKFGETAEGTASSVAGFATAGASLGAIIGPEGAALGALVGTLAGVTAGLIAGGESVDDYRDKFEKLGTEIDKFGRIKALEAFSDNLGFDDFVAGFSGDAKAFEDEIKALARTSPAAAQKVVKALEDMRDASGKPIFSPKEIAILEAALAKGTKGFQNLAVNQKKSQETNQSYLDSVLGVADGLDTQTAAQDAAAEALKSMASAATSQLPSVGEAFSAAATEADKLRNALPTAADGFTAGQKFADALDIGLTPEILLGGLQSVLERSHAFFDDLNTIFSAGFINIGGLLRDKGFEAGGDLAHQLAEGIRSGEPALTEQLNNTASDVDTFAKNVANSFGPQLLLNQFNDSISAIANFTQNLQVLLANGFTSLAGVIIEKGPEAGGEVLQQIVNGINAGDPTLASTLNSKVEFFASAADQYSQFILNTAGPQITQAQRDALAALGPATREALGLTVDEVTNALPLLDEQGRATFNAVVLAARGELPALTTDTSQALTDAAGAITTATPGLGTAGQGAGEATTGGYATGVSGVEGTASAAAESGAQAILGTSIQLSFLALQAGIVIGESFSSGIAAGIAIGSDDVRAAARGVIADAETAARRAADSHSPSRLFALLGTDLAAGVALGITEGTGLVAAASSKLMDTTQIARSVSVPGAVVPVGGTGEMGTTINDNRVIVENIDVAHTSPNPATVAMEIPRQLQAAQYRRGRA